MLQKVIKTLLLILFISLSCHAQKNRQLSNPPKHEFRAVWIATVENIDWPKRGEHDSDQQKLDFIRILNEHKRSNLNAVMVQVRDACDSYYARSVEPWSEFLTGQQGKFPNPFYDPLSFMVTEAHDRNLEFHAWLNLNRATFRRATSVTPDHISNRKPEWMLTYDGQKLLNFGIPEVREYITNVVLDIVKHYDIDGIHFDDYFYPYQVPGQTLKDEATFRKYSNGFTNIEDWRRNNTDILISQISDAIKKTKPHVKFGISPFGVWKNYSSNTPEGSRTQAGQTSFGHLYADTRKWLSQGWIDYIAPQIYFDRYHAKVPYKELSKWWMENAFGKHLYIGHGVYKIKAGWSLTEAPAQIRLDRQYPQIDGGLFFSSKSLTENYGGFQDSLRTDFYRKPAIIPAMPWKDNIPPTAPKKVFLTRNEIGNPILTWQPGETASDGNENTYFAVYRFERAETPDFQRVDKMLYVGRQNTFTDSTAEKARGYVYHVTSFDRLHNESNTSAKATIEYGEK
ncbi:uncharacterized lipoprotein YddW (UPF0748 family) [Arcicella aurantiaca]|uniref:Uncharacterized lipoprotein YddW (UPF0748 family) n=1 Tax=Arcicella aurantiaca TaxID=591202 RepID=A0A316E6L4_9BACT|nr:family 10 glycosylhydrolase [Arcicella aurantiaca]PWK26357.1 uncharacterized lipoprotein YddW (UPF0748 family) [Arcicella aurantiaca]